MIKILATDFLRSFTLFLLSFLGLFFISHFFAEIKIAFNEFYFDQLTLFSKRSSFSDEMLVVDTTKEAFSSEKEREKSLETFFDKIQKEPPALLYFVLQGVTLKEEISLLEKGVFKIPPQTLYYFTAKSPHGLGFLERKGLPFLDVRTNRIFRREVVRTHPIYSEEGVPSLFHSLEDYFLMEKGEDFVEKWGNFILSFGDQNPLRKGSFLINYKERDSLQIMSLKSLGEKSLSFRDKILFVGSSEFSKTSVSNGKGSFFNTPWHGDESPEHLGRPLLFLYPNLIADLFSRSFIKKSGFESHFLFQFVLFFLAFFSWFSRRRYLGFLYSFLQMFLIVSVSLIFFGRFFIFLDGFSLLGISFAGSFFGSFAVERREIKIKSQYSRSLREENLDSNKDNSLFIEVLKEIDLFVDESRSRLENYLLKNKNKSSSDMTRIIQERSNKVFSHVKGLYHYVLALEQTGLCESEFDLKDLVKELLTSFEDKVEAKKIEIILEIEEGTNLKTDRILFQAIVYNIIFNAVKYTYENTVIKISYSLFEGRPCLSVCDQGPGFNSSEGDVKNFLPNLEKNSKSEFAAKGYGLGLYLSQVIAEKISLDFLVTKDKKFNSIFQIVFK